MTENKQIDIAINGDEHRLAEGTNIAQALAHIGIDATRQGIAVAVDMQVVPRSRWSETALKAGASIDVVTAAQGG